METYKKKTGAARQSEAKANEFAIKPGIPNSAALGMLGGETSGDGASDIAGLDSHFKSRLGRIREDAAAENEADSYAAGMSGAASVAEVKSRLGERLGADFSGVRVHTGAQSGEAASQLGALAFAQGRDVYMGGFDPVVAAHELVHTAQQGEVSSDVTTQAEPSGAVQLWFGKKKKPAPEPIPPKGLPEKPEKLSESAPYYKPLKKASLSPKTSVVAKMDTEKGGSAIVKAGVNTASEKGLSDLYNMASIVRKQKNPDAGWDFDAPAVRELKESEKKLLYTPIQRGDIGIDMGIKMHETDTPEDIKDIMGRMAVFQMSGGKSR